MGYKPKPDDSLRASSLFNVKGIIAVVTGGGTGIGLMITRTLVANHAKRVYIIGRRAEVLEEAAKSIHPKIVVPLVGDVTKLDDLLKCVKYVEKETGYINLLIPNAGIMGPRPLKPSAPNGPPPSLSDYRSHALKTPPEDFTQTYAVNTTAVYYTTMAFLELLDAGNSPSNTCPTNCRSQILATSSIGGFSRLPGASFAYNSSKAALTHLMKMLSTSFIPYKIRCNVLAPGIFPSDLAGGTMTNLVHTPVQAPGGAAGEGAKFEKEVVPAERAGTEEDIAGAVLYVASRAGAYLNGSVVVVDGGRLGTLVSTY